MNTMQVDVKTVFGPDTLLQFGKELASAQEELSALDDEKKEAAAEIKSREKAIQNKINRLSNHIQIGYRVDFISAEVRMNTPEDGKKSLFIPGQDAAYRVLDMTEEEKQEELFDAEAPDEPSDGTEDGQDAATDPVE